MQLSNKGKNKFEELLMEFARAWGLFADDYTEYFKEIKKDHLIFTCINAPDDLQKVMWKKREGKEVCVYQLHHTKKSISLTKQLSEVMHKSNSLNCLPSEVDPLVEAIAYEYVNTELIGFFDSAEENGEKYDIQYDVLEKILKDRLIGLKKGFSRAVYQFPVAIFNLEGELKLTNNIKMVPIGSIELPEDEVANFKASRSYEANYYIEINLASRCSKELSLQLAESARDATYNCLKLLATRLSRTAIPLLPSNDRAPHFFEFYRSGKDSSSLSSTRIRHFARFQSDSKKFWESFDELRSQDGCLIDTTLRIPELLLTPKPGDERVVERLERALLWYGDAVTESNYYQKLQKLVSSLEAVVNFNEDETTKTFIRRVKHLNITHEGLSEDIEDKASKIYRARSNIIHGASTKETLDFCPIEFCSETLLRAVFYLSLFGLERKGFKKSLPKFLDELPAKVCKS